MRFRQVHLDFHTSEAIKGIGKNFSKEQFQEMLKLGHVDSITVFSKCHHGWAYHPSTANEMHPELDFDLLGAMIEAAHEIDVKTPVYISAGLDEKMARRNPQWLIRSREDKTNWVPDFLTPGYHQFCFNSPYLDYLIAQVEETVSQYDADGIFLDIVGVRTCYCQYCMASLREQGLDPKDPQHVLVLGERTYANYTQRVRKAIDKYKPGLPVFHNGGHISRGRRDLAAMNSHLELESLPTGGWGYDHFPLSARYAQGLGMDFLGMTGKFHTSWGEFGGYKHPNALRYEVALSIANGACCSIGDQLHPEGIMDQATYELIGAAYHEVEKAEPWCVGSTNIADIALLSVEAAVSGSHARNEKADVGAVRMLLEGKFLFDVIDLESSFQAYKVIILPDKIRINLALKQKLDAYINNGGKVLATGESGLGDGEEGFVLNLGVNWEGPNSFKPDYFRPDFTLENLGQASFICYEVGQRISLAGGIELGMRQDPYFNRDVFHFCSHQHTPNSFRYGGPGLVESESGIYIAWNVFTDYATKASLFLRETVTYALNRLLGKKKTLSTSLPAQGIVTLTKQQDKNRYVQHLLYASPVRRGDRIEVIEDILPLYDIQVTVNVSKQIQKVYLAPEIKELTFRQEGTNLEYTVPEIYCHQMIVLEY